MLKRLGKTQKLLLVNKAKITQSLKKKRYPNQM